MKSNIFKEIKDRIRYEKSSGKIFWKKNRKSSLVGRECGSMSGNGYRVLTILKHRTSSHRVVWFFENNSYPSGQIDHIDGNVLNNKISNLRDVTPRRNSLNRLIHRTGKMPGCYLSKRSNRIKKWTSVITVFGVKYSLGYFRSAREASEKYKEAVVFIEQNSFRKFNKKYGSKIISIKKRAVIGSHFTRNR